MPIQLTCLGNYVGITESKKRSPELIVSIIAQREQFDSLPITIYSLLNQKLKPDKIILWLDEEYEDLTNLPYEISQYIKNGLEIRFVKDIGEYTKSYYAFKYLKDSIVVIADSRIYYSTNWLKSLYLSYIAHPEDINVHRALIVDFAKPYRNWKKQKKENSSEYYNFGLVEGGMLFPPNCFSNEILRKDIFLKNALINDCIWYWIMALVHKRKIRVIKNSDRIFSRVNLRANLQYIRENKRKKLLFNKNLRNLLKFYRQNVEKLL